MIDVVVERALAVSAGDAVILRPPGADQVAMRRGSVVGMQLMIRYASTYLIAILKMTRIQSLNSMPNDMPTSNKFQFRGTCSIVRRQNIFAKSTGNFAWISMLAPKIDMSNNWKTLDVELPDTVFYTMDIARHCSDIAIIRKEIIDVNAISNSARRVTTKNLMSDQLNHPVSW